MHRNILTSALLFFASISLTCWAADITLFENRVERQIVITGEIVGGDYEKFLDAVLQGGIRHSTVYIASSGGDALEAMKIGRVIRKLRFETEIPQYFEETGGYCKSKPVAENNCICASACVLTYLAGFHRYGDYLGIHRTFLNHEALRNMEMEEAAAVSKRISSTVAEYLDEMGAPPSLTEKMELVPSYDIEYLTVAYIENNLGGYAKEFQEWVVAKCGSTSKLYHQMLAKPDEDKSQKLSAKFRIVVGCEEALKKTERQKAFYPVMRTAIENADSAKIPVRSLLATVKDKYPFEFSQLIGKPSREALDLLSLVGAGSGGVDTPQELAKYVGVNYRVLGGIEVSFDDDGTVYNVNVAFIDQEGRWGKYYGHFLSGLDINSSPSDFVLIYGKPNSAGCYETGVCVGEFSAKDSDIQMNYSSDRVLRFVTFDPLGYWKRIEESTIAR
jgi:hypothetical protein